MPFNVLLAEDDEDLLSLLSHYLTRAGCRVEAVRNGGAARARLRRYPYHALVCDLDLPVLDGAGVLLWLRRREQILRKARLPALVLSAHVTAFNKDLVMGSGADEVLQKPSDCAEVFDGVLAAIGSASRRS